MPFYTDAPSVSSHRPSANTFPPTCGNTPAVWPAKPRKQQWPHEPVLPSVHRHQGTIRLLTSQWQIGNVMSFPKLRDSPLIGALSADISWTVRACEALNYNFYFNAWHVTHLLTKIKTVHTGHFWYLPPSPKGKTDATKMPMPSIQNTNTTLGHWALGFPSVRLILM